MLLPTALRADARYRIVDETRIVDALVLAGWAIDAQRGERARAYREARTALDRWVDVGLPFARSTAGERRFDIVEVLNFMKIIGLKDGDPCWEEQFVATNRRVILAFHGSGAASAAPPLPSALRGKRFRVTFEREFELRNSGAGARTLLRLPLPLEDHALRDLKIDILAPPGVDAEFSVAPGRFDARVSGATRGKLVLGVELSFTAYPTVPGKHPATLAASDVELYTRPREGLIRVSPRIRALAAELAGDETDTLKIVRRNWNYILDELTCGVVHYDELDPSRPTDWPLETGWFDCQLGSALMIALCRARGIPARQATGYFLYPQAPTPHYWAEIWTDAQGWFALDTISSDLSVRGRDPAWRDYFFGHIDYRMKTQLLPHLFNQNPSMPFPPAWHLLCHGEGDVIQIGYFANDSGAPHYRDRVSVRLDDNRDPRN